MRLPLPTAWMVFAALLMLAALPAQARSETCETSVAGAAVQLRYNPKAEVLGENTSLRERVFGGRGKITCPAYVTLRHLTPELSDAERAPFCLQYDKQAATYLGYDQGVRGALLECKTPSKAFCERVNGSKDAAIEIARRGVQIAGDATEVASVVEQGSGAVILSGTGGQMAGTLGSLGSSAMAVLTAPATLTAAAVSVVAVGGAVYVCR